MRIGGIVKGAVVLALMDDDKEMFRDIRSRAAQKLVSVCLGDERGEDPAVLSVES